MKWWLLARNAQHPAAVRLPGCGHLFCQGLFCKGCMRGHLREALGARRFLLPCPQLGCKEALEHGSAQDLLRGHPADFEVLLVLELSGGGGCDIPRGADLPPLQGLLRPAAEA
mmetsp:Transcript_11254/g.24242  ORF Transcript_11254/g.24242 Transcript_11254/m.24242 type:complete len:113 (+) Transcript_11254:308-646(+)